MAVLTKITSRSLADDSITAAHVQADALAAGDIAADAITAIELANDAVIAAKIATGAVSTAKLAADAVTSAKLDDATGVTTSHFKIPIHATDAARNSAISSPTAGMVVYNTNSGALQQYTTKWSTIAPAPAITSISGFLNEDTDSTLTIFGSNFSASTSVKMFDAAAGGSQIGSNATTTLNSAAKLTSTFGAGSLGAAGSTVYIDVDNAGISSRFATGITLNQDAAATMAGNAGDGATTTTHLGTYGGATGGGRDDKDTMLMCTFDNGGGNMVEDDANAGGDAAHGNAAGGIWPSARGFTPARSGTPTVVASPFGDGKSAIRFDGSNNKLEVPGHADFNFGTAAFTIEFWFYFQGSGELFQGHGPSQRIFIEGGKLKGVMTSGSGGNGFFNDEGIISLRWYHCAVVREAGDGNAKMYLDGHLWGIRSFPAGGTVGDSSTTIKMGSGDAWFNGYMDEIRVVKGVAVYTGPFTSPTARLSTTQSAGAAGSNIAAITGTQTSLLIHSNLSSGLPSTTFTDSSSAARTITASGGIFHSTLYNAGGVEGRVLPAFAPFPANGKKFGSNGMYFDGTGDYLSIGDQVDWDFAGTWTIDFWVNPKRITNYDGILVFDGSSSSDISIGFQDTGKIHMVTNAAAGAGSSIGNSVVALVVDTWYHIAIARDGTTTRFFLDGVLKSSNTSWSGAWNTTSGIKIGRWYFVDDEKYFQGYLDGVRIVNGTCHFTEAFTPAPNIYGSISTQTVPTITLTGATTPALASDEDIEFTAVANTTKPANNQKLTDSGIGLALANLTGGNKNKATLTGTIASAAGTTHSNMAMKLQVRKTLGNAAYNNSTTVTFSSSTTTVGLSPAMPVTGTGISTVSNLTCGLTNTDATVTAVSTTGLVVGMQVDAFTGIPAGATILSIITNTSFEISANATATNSAAILSFNTIIASVSSSTVILLSNVTTGGNLTGQSLVFTDPDRTSHMNGSDVLEGNESQSMLTLATGSGAAPVLFYARRYRGNGTVPFEITGYGFNPDLVWIQQRDGTEHNVFYDTIRGQTKRLHTAVNEAEATIGQGVRAFVKDGFHVGTNHSENRLDYFYVAWGFKAGGMPDGTELVGSGATMSGTSGAGTIHNSATGVSNATTLTQSVSQTSGFSITKFTGGSNSGGAFPHNLGGTPAFIIIKNLAGGQNWTVWHQNLTASAGYFLYLNTNAAENGSVDSSIYGTAPSSTVINYSSNPSNMGSSSAIGVCYAWKTVAGVSAFGTYEGSAGAKTVTFPNSETFTPRFIMIKNIDASANWHLYDTFRGMGVAGATTANLLFADSTAVEDHGANYIAPTAGGWTMNNGGTGLNASNTYIYCAFA